MLKIEMMKLDDIQPYENNAKIHTEEQVEQIKKSLKRRLSKLEEKNEYDADVIVLTNEEEEQFLNESLKKFVY